MSQLPRLLTITEFHRRKETVSLISTGISHEQSKDFENLKKKKKKTKRKMKNAWHDYFSFQIYKTINFTRHNDSFFMFVLKPRVKMDVFYFFLFIVDNRSITLPCGEKNKNERKLNLKRFSSLFFKQINV